MERQPGRGVARKIKEPQIEISGARIGLIEDDGAAIGRQRQAVEHTPRPGLPDSLASSVDPQELCLADRARKEDEGAGVGYGRQRLGGDRIKSDRGRHRNRVPAQFKSPCIKRLRQQRRLPPEDEISGWRIDRIDRELNSALTYSNQATRHRPQPSQADWAPEQHTRSAGRPAGMKGANLGRPGRG